MFLRQLLFLSVPSPLLFYSPIARPKILPGTLAKCATKRYNSFMHRQRNRLPTDHQAGKFSRMQHLRLLFPHKSNGSHAIIVRRNRYVSSGH